MKYVITEQQYQEYRKSTIKKFLRRVFHRLDGILYETIKHLLQYYRMKDLINMGEEVFVKIVVDETFEYIYEGYIEEDLIFNEEEQDIIKDFIHNRYYKDIKDEYLIHINESNINESEITKDNNKRRFFQELINDTLKYILEGCDKSYDEFFFDISFDACEYPELVEEIKILEIIPKEHGIYRINLKITYSSIKYLDFTPLLYNIEQIMKRKTGINFKLYDEDNNNLNTNLQR
jgi:hypothetical protein